MRFPSKALLLEPELRVYLTSLWFKHTVCTNKMDTHKHIQCNTSTSHAHTHTYTHTHTHAYRGAWHHPYIITLLQVCMGRPYQASGISSSTRHFLIETLKHMLSLCPFQAFLGQRLIISFFYMWLDIKSNRPFQLVLSKELGKTGYPEKMWSIGT